MSDHRPDYPAPETPFVGRVINDRYRVIRVLGQGGMGTVYEVEHELIGRRLALKTLLPEYTDHGELVARFRREARAASTIGHDHIVDVTDMGSLADGSPYIVMEMLAGKELADLIEAEGPLPTGRAVRIALKVCSALFAAHGAGIVHRDLKPANIFLVDRVDGSDYPKVLDFGISKMHGPGADDHGLTKTGVAMGTPTYMSPEQVQGLKTLDHRTDVYAMGVILHEMLSGQLPFHAESYASLVLRVMTEEPPALDRIREDLPPGLSDVVLKALAKYPEDRFATMDELADAIAPFAHLDTTPRLRAGETSPERPSAASPAPSAGSGAGPLQLASQFGPTSAGRPSAMPEPPSAIELPKKRLPIGALIGVGALALAGAVVGIVYAFGGGGEVTKDSPPSEAVLSAQLGERAFPAVPSAPIPEHAPEPVKPGGAQPVTPVEPVAAIPAEVRIQIRVRPGDARIFIGETRFPSPMDAQQPRSLSPSVVRIERTGYRTIERVVIFDQDRSFDFEMARGRGVDRQHSMATSPATAAEDAPANAQSPRGGQERQDRAAMDDVYRGVMGGSHRGFE